MKHIKKITFTIVLLSVFVCSQAYAQTARPVGDSNMGSITLPSANTPIVIDKGNTIKDSKLAIKTARVNAIKVYGVVDRNGKPLPTKEEVNNIPR